MIFFSARRAPTWSRRDLTLEDRLIIDSADGFLRDLAEYFKTPHRSAYRGVERTLLWGTMSVINPG